MLSRRLAAVLMVALAATPTFAQTARRGGPDSRSAAQQGEAPPQKQEKMFPLGTQWLAVSLNGKAYSGAHRPAFTIDQNFRARGFGGCNTFSATAYPLRQQGLGVGPLAMTKKDCGKEAMAAERAYLIAVRAAQKWDVVDGQLVLTGQGGTLKFERSL
ncbi:META domain-containing protein [Chelatococcus sp. SYSU_G07232]|uniref:META domain-containing protein n=1 Tax=Chelatococcus albus TaxID=3047466 RepID=A0ABT7AEU8_9HYPH|nr:META domain-containing protein [Chelatococcus sp. SYSU_G07232]MDJ1157895.1 META domain-containing protein [Chelatococcus sp. SYSU_G07232]